MSGGQGPETVKKLEWILSRATGYFGLTNYLGSKFLASDSGYQTFSTALHSRGLELPRRRHGRAPLGQGCAPRHGGTGDRRPGQPDRHRPAVLLALEASARQRGQALGSGFAYPVTLQQVAQWSRSLNDRGFQLAPASALAR